MMVKAEETKEEEDLAKAGLRLFILLERRLGVLDPGAVLCDTNVVSVWLGLFRFIKVV